MTTTKLGRKYKDVEAPKGTKTGAVVLSAPVASHSDGTDPKPCIECGRSDHHDKDCGQLGRIPPYPDSVYGREWAERNRGYDAGLVEQEERWADVDEARLQEAE